jgi:hypothetical protein
MLCTSLDSFCRGSILLAASFLTMLRLGTLVSVPSLPHEIFTIFCLIQYRDSFVYRATNRSCCDKVLCAFRTVELFCMLSFCIYFFIHTLKPVMSFHLFLLFNFYCYFFYLTFSLFVDDNTV